MPSKPLKVVSSYQPAGDQPKAIDQLVDGINRGLKFQTLLGITGSGKSATIAWTIEKVQKPTLILAPNKALAAQLANEMKQFFPDNRVTYFASYYDYFQPEAYVPQSDTFIEKSSVVNAEIERLRHEATSSLLSRKDVIVCASVSAIYGLGSPEEYQRQLLRLFTNTFMDRDYALRQLVAMLYNRNDISLTSGTFRVRGDTLEVLPPYDTEPLRIEFFGDEIERITRVSHVTGEVIEELDDLTLFPASQYVTSEERIKTFIPEVEAELQKRINFFEKKNKLVEAQRLNMRTQQDMEMMRELGFCPGIENYSRYLDGRTAGQAPYTLLDYFPDDFLLVMDESHVMVPQLNGMYKGDKGRKETLIEFGFRLPSALDNRPLQFEETVAKISQCVFLSATPGPYELEISEQIVEQIIRPTGLVDPVVEVRSTRGQIDDLIGEIQQTVEAGNRVIVTTLTKKMAEDVTEYFTDHAIKTRYLHHDIDTVERIELLRDLRLGVYDVIVGINLLREGLDLPEVALVAILDADREGFLRSESSLIQTIGRAARNVSGRVLMYADSVTPSMQRAIRETARRRELQIAYNEEHGIKPETIRKAISDILATLRGETITLKEKREAQKAALLDLDPGSLDRLIADLEEEMGEAATELRFEQAARLRDEISELERERRDFKSLS